MSSGGTSDNVATCTFDSLIGDSNSVLLASSSSILACVSSISGELMKFNYGHRKIHTILNLSNTSDKQNLA
jgi:hypothetical protein